MVERIVFAVSCYLIAAANALFMGSVVAWFGQTAEPELYAPWHPLMFFLLALVPQLGLILAPTASSRKSLIFRVPVALAILPPLAFHCYGFADSLGLNGHQPESPIVLPLTFASTLVCAWALFRIAAGARSSRSAAA
jgi:hypothetical protein